MTGPSNITTTRDPVKIVANIFISFIGAGVLGLPYAFKRVRQREIAFYLQGEFKTFYFLGGNTGGYFCDGLRQLLLCESYDATRGVQIQSIRGNLSV